MPPSETNTPGRPPAFAVKDCALAAIATGVRAQTLRELRDRCQDIHPGAIYYHFWGRLLRARFDNPEFTNDFAQWAHEALHDTRLAERLGVIDPTAFEDTEALRQELIEVCEERLDELTIVPSSASDQQFSFIRSQIVVFDTHARITHPEELSSAFAQLSLGSIFYHFIDARRRTDECLDDFRLWLADFGALGAPLVDAIAELDPYFAPLSELRANLVEAAAAALVTTTKANKKKARAQERGNQ